MTARAALLLALILLLAPAGPAAAQCSMCKAALEGAVEGQQIAAGLNHGILLMMAAPYAILGAFLALALRPRLRAALARRGAVRARPIAAGE